MRMPLCLLAVLSAALSPVSAQPAAGDRETLVFNADSKMVLVPTTVMSRRGAIVSGLPANVFRVTQDNTPQRIASFGEQDVPVSIGVVLDTSGSMRRVLPEARNVVRAFFNASNPEDEAFLYTVSTRPGRDTQFTSDVGSLLQSQIFRDAGGATALVDTIYAAMLQTRHAHRERKALLVVSDGMDNHSRYSKAELMSAAMEADLQIYSITVYDPPLTKKPIELKEERDGMAFLEEITRRTGGVQMVVRSPGEIDRAAVDMARAIRDQYVIGYVPSGTGDNGQWHSIKVSLNVSDAKAYARSGFYSK